MGELGSHELRLMQDLSQRVAVLRPELVNGDASVGELAWVWGKDFDMLHPFWKHRLWLVDDEPVAWGWARLPHRLSVGDEVFMESHAAELIWQVHPDRPELLSEILDWYDEVAGDVDRTLTLQVADHQAGARVAAHGYVFDSEVGSDEGYWIQANERDLVEIPDPVLPEGFRFVTAKDISVAEAVRAHRSAWPWTQLTEAALERVQGTWPYRTDLHVLIQAPDGELAASAIVWLDEVARIAEFEPVGTHREFRRRGLGTALQLHGMQRARAFGANRMMVACLGAPAYPAARNMYYGVGFREFTRDVPQIKFA